MRHRHRPLSFIAEFRNPEVIGGFSAQVSEVEQRLSKSIKNASLELGYITVKTSVFMKVRSETLWRVRCYLIGG